MTVFVSIETETSTMRRYEIGGGRPRMTHECETGERRDIAVDVVDQFRTHPPGRFKVQAMPFPTDPAVA